MPLASEVTLSQTSSMPPRRDRIEEPCRVPGLRSGVAMTGGDYPLAPIAAVLSAAGSVPRPGMARKSLSIH